MKKRQQLASKSGLAIALMSLVVSCATKEKAPRVTPERGASPRSYPRANVQAIAEHIGMNQRDLGLSEKVFDQCELPKRLQFSSLCGDWVLSKLKVKITCRNSQGTTQTAVNMTRTEPFTALVNWSIGSQRGRFRTNSRGEGALLALTRGRVHGQRLILKSGGHFLGVRTNEATRILVPSDWCE